jgi:hypothetical protein
VNSTSDHHLPADSGYLIVHAVIDTLMRRTIEQITSRHIHVDALHIDTAARTADVNGTPVDLGRKEFEILTTLAQSAGSRTPPPLLPATARIERSQPASCTSAATISLLSRSAACGAACPHCCLCSVEWSRSEWRVPGLPAS